VGPRAVLDAVVKRKITSSRRESCPRTPRVYPKVSGLALCSENCKWYSSLPLGAVLSLFCVSLASFAVITLCVASQRMFVVVVVVVVVYFVMDSVRKLV
jgi:hypothetical protein